MTKVVIIGSQKGGVGKTTITINFVFYLIAAGYKVLCIDGDAQGNATEKLAKTLDGDPLDLYGHTYADLFQPDIADVQVMHCPRGFDLLHTPANDAALSEKMQLSLEDAMMPKKHLAGLIEQYDFVVMDSPPALGSVLFSQLVMADFIFIPIRVSSFASTGAAGLITTTIGVKHEHNPKLDIAGVIINFYKPQSRENQRSLSFLQEELGDTLLQNVINDRVPVDTAIDFGVPIKELNYAHVAAREVNSVMDEMMERIS